MRQLIKEWGCTVLMITHDMEVVAEYATRVMVVQEGRIVMDGTPRDVFHGHFSELTGMFLRPPFVVELAQKLVVKGFDVPRWLTLDEFIRFCSSVT